MQCIRSELKVRRCNVQYKPLSLSATNRQRMQQEVGLYPASLLEVMAGIIANIFCRPNYAVLVTGVP